MSLVAIAAAKGSPGATTTSAALASAEVAGGRVPLLIECDPAGGTIALDAQLGLDPGLLTLAAASRRGLDPSQIEVHCQRLANSTRVLVAPTSPERASSGLAAVAQSLAASLPGRQGLTLVDCGRWDGNDHVGAMISAADVLLVVLRPSAAGAEHVRARLASLTVLNPRIELVCVGENPYPAEEVASALGMPRALSVADDERSAALVRAGAPVDRWLRRTPLLRTTRDLLERLDLEAQAPEMSA